VTFASSLRRRSPLFRARSVQDNVSVVWIEVVIFVAILAVQ
jgi:hypothetical protein